MFKPAQKEAAPEKVEESSEKDDFQKRVDALLSNATPEQLEYVRSCLGDEDEEETEEYSTEDMPKD